MMARAARFVCPIILLVSVLASAQTNSPSTSPGNVTAAKQSFDVNAAVETYLAKMPPAERARSNAYFEGGYWLILWDFLSTVFVMWLLLRFRWSARMRNLAERITRFRPLQTALYWIQFLIVMSVLTFPMTIYEGYFREHKYGLLNQTFGPWMRDQLVGLAVGLVLGSDPRRAAVRARAAIGQELVGVGRRSRDCIFCIRKSDRPGLHFSSV